MKNPLTVLAAAAAVVLLSPAAFAQSKGEADYQEQCMRQQPQGTTAEQAATRQRCRDEARQAARKDVPGNADQPGTSATRGAATKAERKEARDQRRAAGAAAAREPHQDPRNPTGN